MDTNTLDNADAEPGDAVALLRAGIAGDVDGQNVIMRSTDPLLLVEMVSALALAIGTEACGSLTALDTRLASWQQRTNGQGGGVA